MGIFDYLFDNEYRQRDDINSLKLRTKSLNKGVLTRARQTHELKNRVDELELLCRAMYVYMKQQGNFDSAKFHAILNKIDEQDGERDGKVTRSPKRNRKHT